MRRCRRPPAPLLAACLLTGLLAPDTPARAQEATTETAVERQAEIEEQIRELQGAVGEASAAETELLGRLEDVQGRLDVIDGRIAAIDTELAGANARLAGAQERVNRLDGRYLDLTGRLRITERRIDMAEDDVTDVAVELYQRAGTEEAGFTSLVLDAETPEDLFAGSRYLSDTAAAGRERIRDLEALEAQVEDLRGTLEAQRHEAQAARDEVAEERGRIAALRDEQEGARAEVNLAVAEQQDLLEEARSRQSEFQSEIAALQAESDSIAALLRERSSTVEAGSGALIPPVSAPITSVFGMRYHPILGYSRMHSGVDFGAAAGTSIHAAAAGEVVEAGVRGGYGNTVIVDHGGGLATLYAHQTGFAVAAGDVVAQGDTVGYVGSTGLSTGPHLHFEVRLNGVPVDPLGYL